MSKAPARHTSSHASDKPASKHENTKEYTILTDGTIIEGKQYKAGEKVKLTDEECQNHQKHGVALSASEDAK